MEDDDEKFFEYARGLVHDAVVAALEKIIPRDDELAVAFFVPLEVRPGVEFGKPIAECCCRPQRREGRS